MPDELSGKLEALEADWQGLKDFILGYCKGAHPVEIRPLAAVLEHMRELEKARNEL